MVRSSVSNTRMYYNPSENETLKQSLESLKVIIRKQLPFKTTDFSLEYNENTYHNITHITKYLVLAIFRGKTR